MNKRERVMAAIRGEPVDRVPFSFWLHNFAREDSAQALTEETLRLHRAFDWDFLKPQSRYQCFAEMWGLEYRQAPDRAEWPVITKLPVRSAADLATIAPADPMKGALAEQLEAMSAIKATVGPDVPVVATVFAPLMVAQFMVPGGIDAVLKLAREDAPKLERGLEAIAATQEAFTRELVARGVDGIFYATNVATKNLLSPGEFRRFQRPYDRRILEAAGSLPFNIVHMCGGAQGRLRAARAHQSTPTKGKSTSGRRPARISAIARPEPHDCVHPTVPWPAFTSRPFTAVLPT